MAHSLPALKRPDPEEWPTDLDPSDNPNGWSDDPGEPPGFDEWLATDEGQRWREAEAESHNRERDALAEAEDIQLGKLGAL